MAEYMKFTGAIPALVTPLNPDESLNISALQRLVAGLMEQEADAFYVGGATGEGIALGRETREQLTEETIRAVNGRKPCIIHVAATEFKDAVALAKHAEASGAQAISAVPPFYFKYDENDVYNYYKKLAESVHIPLMVYYSPAVNFPISVDFAARLYEIDNVTAIKWTSSEFGNMLRLKHRTNGEINILNGHDNMLLMGLSAGADGGIGTTYNIMLPMYKAIYQNFQKGDFTKAYKIQQEAAEIVSVLTRYNSIPATKAVLECMGYMVGNAAFPMKQYSQEQKEQIYAEMKQAGL